MSSDPTSQTPTGLHRWFPLGWRDHELLDSGGGSKLERFGDLVLIRPEPHAIWDRGLTESERDRVFEPFYTGRPEGTGLGLYVSYGIVERHGGRIEVTSRKGQGTCFSVRLPRTSHGVEEAA